MTKIKLCLLLSLASLPFQIEVDAADFTFTTVDFPGNDFTYLTGINNSGQVIGQYGNGNGGTFLYSGGVFSLVQVPWAGATQAMGINDNGEIVGGVYSPFPELGFRLSGGSATAFSFPFSASTAGTAINNQSDVAGYYTDSSQTHAFLLSNNTFTTIDPPGATWAVAYGINDLGQAAGTYSMGLYTHGFVASNGTFTFFDCPGPSYESTYISGINNSQEIAGTCGADYNANFDQGFVVIGGVLSRVDFPGASGTHVTGLNDKGQLVGSYSLPGRVGVQGFVATPVPEPGTLALVWIGAGLVASRMKHYVRIAARK